MKINEFIRMFLLVKSNDNNFCFELSGNYPLVFRQMIKEFNSLNEETKERFTLLNDLSEIIVKETSNLTIVGTNDFIKKTFRNSLINELSSNKYILKKKNNNEFYLHSNPEFIEEEIKNYTGNEIKDIQDAIMFYDQIDSIMNYKEKDVKRK